MVQRAMRTAFGRSRIRLTGAVVALLVPLGVGVTLAIGAPRAHQARAVLALNGRNPLSVRGTGFKAHTRVRVTLFASREQVRRPMASGRGAFTTTFSAVIDRCSGWRVTAIQPGRATVILNGPKPECPPA
jgi:hypothetical protein